MAIVRRPTPLTRAAAVAIGEAEQPSGVNSKLIHQQEPDTDLSVCLQPAQTPAQALRDAATAMLLGRPKHFGSHFWGQLPGFREGVLSRRNRSCSDCPIFSSARRVQILAQTFQPFTHVHKESFQRDCTS